MRIGGGSAGGRRIGRRGGRARGDPGLRPTSSRVRLAVFSMLGPGGVEGTAVLDLYAGTGAIGLEALSRGAERAVFVEINERRCEDIRGAAEKLGYGDRVTVRRGRCERVTESLDGAFDIVFIDPPYAESPFARVIGNLEAAGSITPGAAIFAEHSARVDLAPAYGGLVRADRRRYGDTAVSTYRFENRPAEGPPGTGEERG